jgi:flagellar assembly protein FliH
MIHVSKEDYEYISSNKTELFEGIPGADNTEIVPDITLNQGQAMIDTGSGIFDCSVGTELEGLKKQLMLLSYKKGDET